MAIVFDEKKIQASFKAYDVRGRVPEDLDEDLAYGIGRAYAQFLKPKCVVVGQDIRLTSSSLVRSLIEGLTQSGVDVLTLGVCGTEHVYFVTFHENLDGGIMVTASHNPPNYNGMKMVREKAQPISADTGLKQIAGIIRSREFPSANKPGSSKHHSFMKDYIQHLTTLVAPQELKSFKVVCNCGNGTAGPTVDALEDHLPFQLTKVYPEPDGNFPHGVPNPLLPENREVTSEEIRKKGADLGVAWDGDFDRCFFFDESGDFVDSYYIVGLFAQHFLQKEKGGRIIYDPRLTWNTLDQVNKSAGEAIQHRSGHAFMKKAMRDHQAVYGGESSAHHYFRDFGYCDSGMVPWLVLTQIMSETGKPLSILIEEQKNRFPVSGEINVELKEEPDVTIERIRDRYQGEAIEIDEMDGLSFCFSQWRFNIRKSNTEPLIRLNVESRQNVPLLNEKTEEVLELIKGK